MKIIQNGDKYIIADITNTHDSLPIGNYILKFDPNKQEFYLIKKEDFILPKKVYGDQSITNRWVKSWENNSEKNLGIILTGLKGSGKTITAQKFCIEAKQPVIMINEPFYGSEFLDFMSNPKFHGSTVFIDEYEKIYNKDEYQKDLLSLMDGNFTTKLVFLLTVNNYTISDYLINRPNRVKYVKQYNDLEISVIEDVINDLLINKEHADSIYKFFDIINMRTFDILINLIKEMNLFGEDAIVCGSHLNLRSEPKTFEVFEIIDDKEYPCYNTTFSPASDQIEISRKSVEYIKDKKTTKDWDLTLSVIDCVIDKTSEKSIMISCSKTGLNFRFKESSWGNYKLVF